MYKKIKRILSILALIVIAGLYLAVLLLSFSGSEQAGELLMIAIVATGVLPVLLYIYFWLIKLFKGPDQE